MRVVIITSIKDPRIVEARELGSVKGRSLIGKYLVEGEQAIRWAIEKEAQVQHLFVDENYQNEEVLALLASHAIPLLWVSSGVLRKVHGRSYDIPLVGVVCMPSRKRDGADFIVVLDNVQDQGNIGTIVRTAAAFDMHDIVFISSTTDMWHAKTVDASRGTLFGAHVAAFTSSTEAIQYLKGKGYRIVVTTPHGNTTLQPFAKFPEQPIAIVVGNETEGVSEQLLAVADDRIKIPMGSSVESLNVGVAAGISLYELRIKWVLAMLQHKIPNTLARNLGCASRWIRKIFDEKLKESTPFTAQQVILLMILVCDRSAPKEKLLHDVGLHDGDEAQKQIAQLEKLGYLFSKDDNLSITTAGEEAVAQLWFLHDEVEARACAGVSAEELMTFKKVLEKILNNCAEVTSFD